MYRGAQSGEPIEIWKNDRMRNPPSTRHAQCTGIALVAVAALALAWSARADKEPPAPDELTTVRQIYDTHRAGITDDAGKSLDVLNGQYLRALEEYREKMRKAGNPTEWTAADKAIKRAQEDDFGFEMDVSADSPGIAALQRTFVSQAVHCQAEKCHAILSLADQYLKHLEQMKVNYTRGGEIEIALRVQEELNRVRGSDDIAAAKFELTAIDAESDADRSSAQEAHEPVAASPQQDRPQEINGFQIYSLKKGPAIEAMSFDNLRLTSTDNVGVGRRLVSVSASLGTRKDIEKNKFTTSHSHSKSESGEWTHLVRLTLRSSSASRTLQRPTVVVQLYAETVKDRSGREPELVAQRKARLDAIRPDWMTIDSPEIILASVEHDFRGVYAGRRTFKAGLEFYGVVISVFDSEGGLAYQGVSRKALAGEAVTTIPGEQIRRDQEPFVLPEAPHPGPHVRRRIQR